MPAPRIVVIGASSGGIETLRTVVRALPADFSAPVCVVVHSAPESPGLIDVILSRVGPLAAYNAQHGDRLLPGRIYVAPPDYHLIVEPGTLHLSRGPKENRFRPAIDPLFRSAAQVYGPGAIGVILSGGLDDGTAGLRAIKQLGGVAVVQDPADAVFPSMPRSALRHVAVDHVVPAAEIGAVLASLVSMPVDDVARAGAPADVDVEVRIAREDNPMDAGLLDIGDPSPFACPECHGVLLRLKDAGPARFRCHTGHGYSVDSLIAAVNDAVEESLWSSMRALQEGMLLLRHLQQHIQSTEEHRDDAVARQIDVAKSHVELLRRVVTERATLITSGDLRRDEEARRPA